MGGVVVRHEPNSVNVLLQHPEALEIFRRARWLSYFEKLQGFSVLVAL